MKRSTSDTMTEESIESLRADRDHAEISFQRAIGIAETNAKKIEALQAELERRAVYTSELENDYSRQGLAYRTEIADLRAALKAVGS